MTLRTLDLNLLKVLDALIVQRNVTRAAQTLGRSQPALSNALRRLRDLLGDELFVRGAHGMVLTPRAQAMRQRSREVLALVENGRCSECAVRSGDGHRPLRISTPDRLTLAVVPPLFIACKGSRRTWACR